jgi:hypothetical protein
VHETSQHLSIHRHSSHEPVRQRERSYVGALCKGTIALYLAARCPLLNDQAMIPVCMLQPLAAGEKQGAGAPRCQKCLQVSSWLFTSTINKDLCSPAVAVHCQVGHWTYQCKGDAVYQSRPSRTQQLLNPKVSLGLWIAGSLFEKVAAKL